VLPDYINTFTWEVNIGRLASKLRSILAERAKTRETLEPYPSNMPVLVQANLDAVSTFDAETKLLEWQALAAERGLFWFDPDSRRIPTVAMNQKLQTWVTEARSIGKLLYPQEMTVSSHSFSDEAPMMVRRGV